MNTDCNCKLEQPCADHLSKALGDKLPPSATVSINSQTFPSWLSPQFQLWHQGKIPESDFLQVIQYMAKNGIILVNGKNPFDIQAPEDTK